MMMHQTLRQQELSGFKLFFSNQAYIIFQGAFKECTPKFAPLAFKPIRFSKTL